MPFVDQVQLVIAQILDAGCIGRPPKILCEFGTGARSQAVSFRQPCIRMFLIMRYVTG